ncbi:cellulase family glycosylhydrolase [bacterium]|nr:cellulase family glycosylhydrolase [bacterium]
MKIRLTIFLFSLCSLTTCPVRADTADPPFHRGVNLSGWFQFISSASEIQFTRFDREDFKNIRSLGCDHIRLPLELYSVAGPAPEHVVDPLFFKFLDEVIGWAEDLGLHLILDNHSFDPSEATSQAILDHLVPVWLQIAARYAGRSSLIYYELLNEPHGIPDSRWNAVQQEVIQAIRSVDSTHTLVVGPAGWNSYDHLKFMPVYSDTNLIYTFHFYDPYIFTHQGATWMEPSAENLAGVPYPYDADRMPGLPAEYVGTWLGSEYQAYEQKGTDAYVASLLDIAIHFGREREVPLWCGEFGVYIPNSHTDDRARWHETVRSYLEAHNIAWSLWEYAEGFGIFEPGSYGLFESDVNLPIIEALGLNSPPQTGYQLRPDSTSFAIYDDYVARHILLNPWLGSASANFYHTDSPASGDYCITWADANQYDNLSFRFSPVKDFTCLLNESFWLEMQIRGSMEAARIDLRFVDTDTDDPDDHPWRMRYTIDNRILDWDGTWQTITIPLTDFREHGAWEDTWFDSKGEFDWARIEFFEIVAEHHDLQGIELAFDEIRVTDESGSTGIEAEKSSRPNSIVLHPVFPNPFNRCSVICYWLSTGDRIQLKMFDIRGREVCSLVDGNAGAGRHRIYFDAADLPSGVYLIRLQADQQIKVQRVLLLK